MKLMNYIIGGVLVLGLSLSACSDFLDIDPKNTRTTVNFYETPSQMEQGLMGIYNALLPLSEYYWFMSEVRSDNTWNGDGTDTSTPKDYIQISTFNRGIYQLETINDAWLDLYEVVARANTFLSKTDGVEFLPEGVKEQQIAEARFLRAFAYFDLVRFFGRIPVTLEPVSIEEAMRTGQSEAVDVYNNVIIPDLEYAIANLTDSPKNYSGTDAGEGRVKLQAAKALLGRVYLTMSGYPLYDEAKKDKAKDLLEQVIDYADSNGKFWANTADEWKRIWISDNDNKYHIFEIQYMAQSGYGNPMVFWSLPKVNSNYISISMSGYDTSCSSSLNVLLKEEVDESSNYVDVRCLGTIDVALYPSKNFFVKLFEHKMKRAELGYSDINSLIVDRNYFPINFPIIRLEDVMLMYAEIVGPTEKGVEMVNRIRNRAVGKELTAEEKTPDKFQECVALERRKELAGEGIRWHDQVRQNTYIADIQQLFIDHAARDLDVALARVVEGTYLYPIPDAQMKVKDGLYQQNEAYR